MQKKSKNHEVKEGSEQSEIPDAFTPSQGFLTAVVDFASD
jgi:hypothetical protein